MACKIRARQSSVVRVNNAVWLLPALLFAGHIAAGWGRWGSVTDFTTSWEILNIWRIAQGSVPCIDLPMLYGPLTYLFYGKLVGLTSSFWTIWLGNLVVVAAMALIMYQLGRLIANVFSGALAAALMLSLAFCVPLSLYFVITTGQAAVHGAMFHLVLLWLMVAVIQAPSLSVAWIGLGLVTGASFCGKIEQAFAAFLTLGIFLFIELALRKERGKFFKLACVAAGFCVLPGLLLSYFLLQQVGWAELLSNITGPFQALVHGQYRGHPSAVAAIKIFLLLFLYIYLVYASKFKEKIKQAGAAAVFLAAAWGYIIWSRSPEGIFYLFKVTLLAVTILSFCCGLFKWWIPAWKEGRWKDLGVAEKMYFYFTVLSCGIFLRSFYSGLNYMVYNLSVPILVALSFFTRLFPVPSPPAGFLRFLKPAFLLAIFLPAGFLNWRSFSAYQNQPVTKVDTFYGSLFLRDTERTRWILKQAEFIRQRTDPGEPVAATSDFYLHFIAGRPFPPIYYSWLYWPYQEKIFETKEVAQMERSSIRYFLVELSQKIEINRDGVLFDAKFGVDFGDEFMRWLERNGRIVDEFKDSKSHALLYQRI